MRSLYQDDPHDKKVNTSFQSRPLRGEENDVISTESPFCTSTLEIK
jgi:hypothetical protein